MVRGTLAFHATEEKSGSLVRIGQVKGSGLGAIKILIEKQV